MSHYRQSLVLEADTAAVYAALTTPQGLRGWWTHDCDVAAAAGGIHRFRFGPNRKAMRIERLDPEREVRWTCVDAHIAAAAITRRDEWIGTELVFRLAQDGERRSRLDFEHVGLVPDFECYGICSDGWRHYLGSLRRFVETGHGTPHERAATAAET